MSIEGACRLSVCVHANIPFLRSSCITCMCSAHINKLVSTDDYTVSQQPHNHTVQASEGGCHLATMISSCDVCCSTHTRVVFMQLASSYNYISFAVNL